ncbi:MAG: DUF1294 domain-containing protein [Peptococcaceae bacterium]|nr:DUF1294 domain-containing protein [Peptococcaceae bacterium]
MKYYWLALAIWNIVTLLITGYDKLIAGSKRRRIPEKTLLLLAACQGALGVYAAMYLFHHKTRHQKFTLGVPVLVVGNIVLTYFLVTRVHL